MYAVFRLSHDGESKNAGVAFQLARELCPGRPFLLVTFLWVSFRIIAPMISLGGLPAAGSAGRAGRNGRP
jgi:hypothetical protein